MLWLSTSHHQAMYKKPDRYAQIIWNEVLDQHNLNIQVCPTTLNLIVFLLY